MKNSFSMRNIQTSHVQGAKKKWKRVKLIFSRIFFSQEHLQLKVTKLKVWVLSGFFEQQPKTLGGGGGVGRQIPPLEVKGYCNLE